MSQPKPQARPEGTTIQADGKKSLNDYATTFYHNATLGAALGSVQQKLSVTDPTKPLPRGTTLFIPGMLVGQGQPKSGGVLIDAAYRRTGAVVLVENPLHQGSFFEGPTASSIFPVNIRQIVNERSIFCGNDSKGWVRNVWFAPAGSMKVEGTTWGVATILTIRVRFLPNPLNKKGRSQRTDPPWGVVPRTDFKMHPASEFKDDDYSFVRGGVDNEKHYSGKLRESPCSGRPTEYTITKLVNPGDPPIALTILFGIGGGDQCEISATTGDPKKAFQSVVTFTNWRCIYYEIIAPDNLTEPILEAGFPFAKKFNSTIEKFLIEKLEKVFIHFVQSSFIPIIMANNPDGIYFGRAVGMDRDKVLLGSQTSMNNLLANIPPSSKKNTIRFILFDMLFRYNEFQSIQDISIKLTAANQKSIFFKTILDENGQNITISTLIPPETLNANILGSRYRAPSYNIIQLKWEADIPQPSLYLGTPTAQWTIIPSQPYSAMISVNSMLLRLTISKGVKGPRIPLINSQGKDIETPISFSANSETLTVIGAQNLANFIKNNLTKQNIRTGQFSLEIHHADSTTPSPLSLKRIDAIKNYIKGSAPLKTAIYLHPCLDKTGTPISGYVPLSWIDTFAIDSVTLNIETSLFGNEQKMGDLVSEYDTMDTAPFKVSFRAATADYMPGFYITGSNQIAYSSKMPADEYGNTRSFSLNDFGKLLLHEIGHAMGMAPFSNLNVANRARATNPQAPLQKAPNYNLANPIPGGMIPLNVDEEYPSGEAGNTYMDSKSKNVTGPKGIRQGHLGSHCAYGIPKIMLKAPNFNDEEFSSKAECIMFDSLSIKGDEFCPICKLTALSRCLNDLQSSWSGRS